MKIILRTSTHSDHPFIFASFLRNRWFDKSNKTTLKRSTWSALHHNRLESLLHTAVVACLDDDVDHIVGYGLLYDQKPYVYVKLRWRSPSLGVKEMLERKLDDQEG